MIVIHLLVLAFYLFFGLSYIFNPAFFHGVPVGDPEINAYIGHSIASGEGLYKDFAIVYGPGRFIILAVLNKLAGVTFSIPILTSYTLFIARILIPFLIYIVTFGFVTEQKNIYRFLISIGASLLYYFFLRSGQDTHVVILIFVLLYTISQRSSSRIISILSGFFLTFIGFFRIEAGILAFISVIVVDFLIFRNKNKNKLFYGSYLVFQIVYFALITLYGSLTNFIHDVGIMGMLMQPKQMGIAIQSVDFPMFEFFLLSSVACCTFAITKKNKSYVLLSLLNLFSFSSALGRADFDHLYYGLVLFFPTSAIFFIQSWQKNIRKFSVNLLFFIILAAHVLLALVIVKKQLFFLLIAYIPLFVITIKLLKKESYIIALFILFLAFYTMIRSFSLFSFYGKRQFSFFNLSSTIKDYQHVPEYFATIKKGNYGGMQLSNNDAKVLAEMKRDLSTKSLFIYPSHVTLYYGLGKKPPIRYIYFNNEYTDHLEKETIQMLINKKVSYVLVSHELTKSNAIVSNQTKKIYSYIQSNYKPTKEYLFGNDQLTLMINSEM